MEEGNPLPLGSQPRCFIDQSNAGFPATLEHVVEVIHRKADVVDAGTAFRDKFTDGGVIRMPLEEFDKRFPAGHTGNAGSISVVEGYDGHLEHISQERQQIIEGTHGDPDVGDAGTAALRFRHVDQSVCLGLVF
jgi:hypothetical protein